MDIMQLKIRSRHRGNIEFFSRGPSEHILVSIDGGGWRQACEGGGFGGRTLMSGGNQDTFEARCRKWWRDHMRSA